MYTYIYTYIMCMYIYIYVYIYISILGTIKKLYYESFTRLFFSPLNSTSSGCR